MSEVNGKKYAPRPGFIPGAQVNFGGHDFVLAPLGLRALREYQDKLKALAERTDPPAQPEEYYEVNVDAIVVSLQRNYPDVTRENVDELFDSANVPDALQKLWDQSGLKRVTPGELKPGS